MQGHDGQALFEAGEDACRDTWSRPPGTHAGWIGPAPWFLAEDRGSGELPGYWLCQVISGQGWLISFLRREHTHTDSPMSPQAAEAGYVAGGP